MAFLFPWIPCGWARLTLVFVVALTDMLDGWWARRFGQVTKLGALLDPLGDKVFALVALFVLWNESLLAGAQISLFLCRELVLVSYVAIWWFLSRWRPFPLRMGSVVGSKAFTVLQGLVGGLVVFGGRPPDFLWYGFPVCAGIAAMEWSTALWKGWRHARSAGAV